MNLDAGEFEKDGLSINQTVLVRTAMNNISVIKKGAEVIIAWTMMRLLVISDDTIELLMKKVVLSLLTLLVLL